MMLLFLALLVVVCVAQSIAAQSSCPPTVTVTAGPATLSGTASSSDSRQVVFTTEFQTTVVTSFDKAVVKTIGSLVNIVEPLEKDMNSSLSTASASCPEAVTITVMANQSQSQAPNTVSTFPVGSNGFSSWTNSTSSLLSTTGDLNSASSLSSNLTASTVTSNITSSVTAFNPTASSLSVSAGLNSTSSMVPVLASTQLSSTTPVAGMDTTSLSGSSLTQSASAPVIPATPGQTSSPVGGTTQASNSGATTAASSFGVALDIWDSPTPTLECSFPCQLKMPCKSLATPTTITFPPYTTSLCKPGCGGIQMKSKTTITLSDLTTNSVCFYPMSATGKGPVTPVPRWITGTSTINAPTGLSVCPPVYANPDNGGKCGIDNHYMCDKKQCCSKDGKCGSGEEYCDKGCQPNYGNCWKNSTDCMIPVFAKTDETTPIPIFPVLYSDDDLHPVKLPPIHITGTIDPPSPICEHGCPDPICSILGCNGKCGIIGCSSIDPGWFKIKIPKIGCHSIALKITCALFKTGCCSSKKSGDNDNVCITNSS